MSSIRTNLNAARLAYRHARLFLATANKLRNRQLQGKAMALLNRRRHALQTAILATHAALAAS